MDIADEGLSASEPCMQKITMQQRVKAVEEATVAPIQS